MSTSATAFLPDDPKTRGDIPLDDVVVGREPLVRGQHTFHEITEIVCRGNELPLRNTPKTFGFGIALAGAVMAMFIGYVGYLFWEGPGIWGNNNPVGWAWDIVNFVWWVGIGHAGTLISAILYLFRQKWRTSINRYAEAMTIFAVIAAGSCVALHTGRIWMDYYLFPIPNQMGLWPNFRSPLEWDVFAVGTYTLVSVLFWYTGLVPDLATLRDRTTVRWRQRFYGTLALGWRGSARHWHVYEKTYQILAALSAPLVLSVHTIVSFDFAVSQLPGWHTTIFPPYFVAGAIFSGFAMVLTLMIPARKWLGLKDLVTVKHIENMNKIILVTGSLVGYAYGMEFFVAAYSGNDYEGFTFINRAFGPYWWAYWIMLLCNVVTPQLFWFRKIRTSITATFILSFFINIGMWFERFVITVTSLARDSLISSWDYFVPVTEVFFFVGTIGLFLTLFLLFVRFFPVIALAELKGVLPQANPHWEGYGSPGGSPPKPGARISLHAATIVQPAAIAAPPSLPEVVAASALVGPVRDTALMATIVAPPALPRPLPPVVPPVPATEIKPSLPLSGEVRSPVVPKTVVVGPPTVALPRPPPLAIPTPVQVVPQPAAPKPVAALPVATPVVESAATLVVPAPAEAKPSPMLPRAPEEKHVERPSERPQHGIPKHRGGGEF